MTSTVLIADDHAETRGALRTIVGHHEGFAVAGEAADGVEALALARRRRPDIVLMDIRMPRLDGLTATRELCAEPDAPAVVLVTTFDEDDYVFAGLQAGARGFLLKSAPVTRIVDALRAVAAGDGLIAPEVTRRLIARFAQVAPARPADPALATLSPRERDVLERIARGMSNGQIAADLTLEETTVKSHVGRLLAKLGLSSRVQAVIWAYETGLAEAGGQRPPARF